MAGRTGTLHPLSFQDFMFFIPSSVTSLTVTSWVLTSAQISDILSSRDVLPSLQALVICGHAVCFMPTKRWFHLYDSGKENESGDCKEPVARLLTSTIMHETGRVRPLRSLHMWINSIDQLDQLSHLTELRCTMKFDLVGHLSNLPLAFRHQLRVFRCTLYGVVPEYRIYRSHLSTLVSALCHDHLQELAITVHPSRWAPNL